MAKIKGINKRPSKIAHIDFDTNEMWLGGALQGGIKGATAMVSTGNPILIGAGALVGAIGGGIFENRRRREIEEAERKARQIREKMEADIRLASDTISFMDYAGGEGEGFGQRGFYKKGGNIPISEKESNSKRVLVFYETFSKPIVYQPGDENLPEELKKYDNEITKFSNRFKEVENEITRIEQELTSNPMFSNYIRNNNINLKEIDDNMLKRLRFGIGMASGTDNKIAEYSNYIKEIPKLRDSINRSINNFFSVSSTMPPGSRIVDDFSEEARNIKSFYDRFKGANVELLPFYGEDYLPTIQKKLSELDKDDDVVFMGHRGNILGGIFHSELAKAYGQSKAGNLYLGSCSTSDIISKYYSPYVRGKPVYYRGDRAWLGFNPRSSNFKEGFFSRMPTDTFVEGDPYGTIIVKPERNVHYNVLNDKNYKKMGGVLNLARPDVLGVRQVPISDGYIDSSASNAGIVRGRSHEQGGVKLAGIELEGNETVVKSPYTGITQVHSDHLGTADISNELVQRKGFLENKLKRAQERLMVMEGKMNAETTAIRRNSYKRQYETSLIDVNEILQEISMVDQKLEAIYQQQEQIKLSSGIQENQQMNLGGNLGVDYNRMFNRPITKLPFPSISDRKFNFKVGDIGFNFGSEFDNFKLNMPTFESTITGADKNPRFNWDRAVDIGTNLLTLASPFIDNIANFRINRRLAEMEIPKPIMDTAVYLDPTYDVSAQMANIDRSTSIATRRLIENISDSRLARSLASEIDMRGAEMKGQLLSERANREIATRNLNRQISQQVNMSNVQRANQYELAKFDKSLQTNITNPSMNWANIEANIIGAIDRGNMKDFQDKQIALQALLSGDTGVFERNIATTFTQSELDNIMAHMPSDVRDRLIRLINTGRIKIKN